MKIDKQTTIQDPIITLDYSWSVPDILVSAKYENKVNSHIRTIGTFTYSNGWKWIQNKDNTTDVKKYFKNLTIEELNIENLEYYTPPFPTGLRVAIPTYWEMLFPDDKFIVGGFTITLERVDTVLVVDTAYLGWEAFQNELQNPQHESLTRHMKPIMEYLKQEATNKNFI